MKQFYALRVTGIILQVIGWIVTVIAVWLIAANWQGYADNFIPASPSRQITIAECLSQTTLIQFSALYLVAGLVAVVLGQIASAVAHLARRPTG